MRILSGLAVLLFITARVAADTWYIPAAANADGAYGTHWRTEAVFTNPGSEPVCADLYFLEAGQDNSASVPRPLEIPAAHSVTINDLVGTYFSSPGKAGAVRLEADGPLVITTRTFNDLGEEGTYGQGIPGAIAQNLFMGGGAFLPGPLISNERFRTNLGFVNASDAPQSFVARLSWSAGRETTWRAITLRPYEYFQWNDPFRLVTGGTVEDGSVSVELGTGAYVILAWASVVDNHTGDPSYVSALRWEEVLLADPRPGIWTTGTSGDDVAHAVWADSRGPSLVLGETETGDAGTDIWWRWEGHVSRFSGPYEDKGFSVRPVRDGGALMAGGTTSWNLSWDAWFIYLQQDGFPVWNLILGTPGDEWAYAAWALDDGSMRFCGQTFADGTIDGDAWVGSMNFEGVEWQYRYGGPGQDWAYAMVPTIDGGLIAAGATEIPGKGLDGWLLALDAQGNILWQKAYGGGGNDMFYGLAATADGNFVAAGQTDSWGTGGWDGWAVKIAPDGTPLWQTVLGTQDADTFFAADAAEDDIVLAGQRGQAGPSNGQAWVVRMDAAGGLRWQVAAGGPQAERLYGVSVAADGRIWAAGRTQSEGAGKKDVLLMALELGGGLGGDCGFITEARAVPISIAPEVHANSSARVSTTAIALGPALNWLSADTVEKEICAPADGAGYTWEVPAAAHADGAGGTRWRTDLAIRNESSQTNPVEVLYFQAGRGDGVPLAAAFDLPAGSLLVLDDVVGAPFGSAGSYGTLEVRASRKAAVTSRTYTPSPDDGTYGQAVPGVRKSESLKRRETGYLTGLTRSPEFRTNAGVTSVSDSPMTVSWEVFRADGSRLGSLSAELGPREPLQINDFLGRFSADELDGAWATVSSDSEGAAWFAYASVADNRTGDPVYIPAVRPTAER